MGSIIVVIRVLPSDIDVDFERLKEEIKKRAPIGTTVKAFDIKPVAFGLNALYVYISMPDNYEGGTTKVEEAISSIQGVEQVDVEFISLEH
ncbi:MAG: elongation factor 1-beta [Thermoprotei archaeon]|jgi:elongation factor 1-beta